MVGNWFEVYIFVFLTQFRIFRHHVVIENANARPPHLVFVVRLGSSGEMLCFLQFLCCVIAACLSLALPAPLGFVTIV